MSPHSQHAPRRLAPVPGLVSLALLSAACTEPLLTRYEHETLQQFRLVEGPTSPPGSAEGNPYWNDPAAVDLGHHLYFDTGLSRSGTTSCDTCHLARTSGADPRGGPTSADDAGVASHRNAPTVYNAGLRSSYSWTSVRTELWAQIGAPLKGPFHGWTTPDTPPGTAELEVERHVCATYADAYQQVFGVPCEVRSAPDVQTETFDNITRALAAYVHRLQSLDSPFDRFVGAPGEPWDASCMPEEAIEGAKLFIGRAACDECHSGPTFSDGQRHHLGLGDEFETLPGSSSPEIVRYQTPTLRHIGQTGPYMHDGSKTTLAEVLRFYKYGGGDEHAEHRDPELQPLELSDEDLLALEAFLEQLEGASLDYCLTHAPACCADSDRFDADAPDCPEPVIRPEPACP